MVLPLVRHMPLATLREPFNDRDWFFEPKWDGFRALAYIDGHQCRLVSRRGHVYKSWPYLRPLHERKRRLAAIMARVESRVRLVEHVEGRGVDFFKVACRHDLEGIVAKWRDGMSQSGPRTSWLKIRNPEYSQWENRRELFEARRDSAERRVRRVRPELALV